MTNSAQAWSVLGPLAAVLILSFAAEGQAQPLSVPCGHRDPNLLAEMMSSAEKVSPRALKYSHAGRKSGITFNLTFNDAGTGRGFDDPARGAQRRAVIGQVLDYVDGVLDHPGRQCDILFKTSETDGTGFLAFATPLYLLQQGFSGGSAQHRLTTGNDLVSGRADMELTFDFGFPWHETLDPPDFNEFDLFTISLHEVTHGLGFISLAGPTGTSILSDRAFSTFDERLHLASPFRRVWDANGNYTGGTGLFSSGPTQVVFVGENTAATLGRNPYVYTTFEAPTGFLQGVSVTHWQDTAPNPPLPLMAPVFFSGDVIREYQPFELATLKDLGFQLAGDSSANPTSWMME